MNLTGVTIMKIAAISLLVGLGLILMSPISNANWCSIKAETAQFIYDNRDTVTKEDALTSPVDAWNEARRAGDEVVEWYKIVDVLRITNDIYREGRKGEFYRSYDDPMALHDLELWQCLRNGY